VVKLQTENEKNQKQETIEGLENIVSSQKEEMEGLKTSITTKDTEILELNRIIAEMKKQRVAVEKVSPIMSPPLSPLESLSPTSHQPHYQQDFQQQQSPIPLSPTWYQYAVPGTTGGQYGGYTGYSQQNEGGQQYTTTGHYPVSGPAGYTAPVSPYSVNNNG